MDIDYLIKTVSYYISEEKPACYCSICFVTDLV